MCLVISYRLVLTDREHKQGKPNEHHGVVGRISDVLFRNVPLHHGYYTYDCNSIIYIIHVVLL